MNGSPGGSPSGLGTRRAPAWRLLRLRSIAMARRLKAHALPLLVLMPLIGGTMLVLLARISADLKGILDGTEAAAWGCAVLLALAAVRRGVGPRVRVDLVGLQPLGGTARRLDGYFSAMGRLAPVVLVAAVVVGVTEGTLMRWSGVLALALFFPLLGRIVPVGMVDVHPLRRGRVGRVTAGVVLLTPGRVRSHVRRDFTLLVRGGVPGAGVALAGCALSLLAVAACTGIVGEVPRPRAALLCGAIGAWAAAAAVFPLTCDRWPRCWVEADAGVLARDFWSARVALGALLGAGAGLAAALIWLPVSPSAAWHFPLGGLAAGAITGAAVMEGDGRPLLASMVALLSVILVTALGTLHVAGLLAVLPVLRYLEGLAVPRVAERFEAVAPGS
ncbi:MAG: hypothetical protein OEY97_04510 [Nitrospirota bacterium]|nr:hypothetical protein [Nitrospirota bacterium]